MQRINADIYYHKKSKKASILFNFESKFFINQLFMLAPHSPSFSWAYSTVGGLSLSEGKFWLSPEFEDEFELDEDEPFFDAAAPEFADALPSEEALLFWATPSSESSSSPGASEVSEPFAISCDWDDETVLSSEFSLFEGLLLQP